MADVDPLFFGKKVPNMAQFLILESTNADGKPTELCINIDQVCRVFTLGAAGAIESMEVHMSDGQRLVLQEEAAAALFAVITHPQNLLALNPPQGS